MQKIWFLAIMVMIGMVVLMIPHNGFTQCCGISVAASAGGSAFMGTDMYMQGSMDLTQTRAAAANRFQMMDRSGLSGVPLNWAGYGGAQRHGFGPSFGSGITAGMGFAAGNGTARQTYSTSASASGDIANFSQAMGWGAVVPTSVQPEPWFAVP